MSITSVGIIQKAKAGQRHSLLKPITVSIQSDIIWGTLATCGTQPLQCDAIHQKESGMLSILRSIARS